MKEEKDDKALAAFFPAPRKGRKAKPTQPHRDKKRTSKRTRVKLKLEEVEL